MASIYNSSKVLEGVTGKCCPSKDEKYSVIITMGKLLSTHLAKITTWAVELNFNLKDFWYEYGAIGLTSFCFLL